ncbi:hypothetical protein P3X46_010225 [Hevea brasiliensis]|uniref:NB-ARC domain-containing protein n=1 Tax=Hevea brasiliensis TaxID=3981 RepID=A0ABQ9MDH0_HEVBR|nr:hypothetical protein P3X46_010225 [Hevea brasiliensis]
MAWMEELCDVCRLAENWAPQNFISQPKLFRQMARVNDQVHDISSKRHGAISSLVSGSNSEESLYQQEKPLPRDADQLYVVSFDKDVDAVITQLLKDGPRCITISIVGVGGIGKTSLAKLIYDSQAIAERFSYRTWVSGEREVDIIQKILGVDDISVLYQSNETEESSEFKLRQIVNALFVDKKYLIVVDTSYPTQFWREMGNWAPSVTDTNLIYRLHLRSDDESWALFKHKLKISIASKFEANLRNYIKKMWRAAKDSTPDELSRMLDQLNQNEEPWSEVLEDINKHLPLYLRRCLFYFGLFPADYKIPARRLIGLWVVEGLRRQRVMKKLLNMLHRSA